MFYIQPARILRIVFAVFIWSSQANAEPASNVTSLYGNTVEIGWEYTAFGFNFGPRSQRYYVTKDGEQILAPDRASRVGPDRGTSFGLDEKLCIEAQLLEYGDHIIQCGSFSIFGNRVNLISELTYWNPERRGSDGEVVQISGSNKVNLVFSVDSSGNCSFVGIGKVLTNQFGTNRLSANSGNCRIIAGRHMEPVDE